MKVLAINTYGGSLLLGARALGAEIIGSYEDSAFGTDIQRKNFPDVQTVPYHWSWKDQTLDDTIVIAHPPCSAFSTLNTSEYARGVDTAAFACTKRVLDYAMKNRAAAICIESVMGALAGAWEVHQGYADTNGYRLYRIVQSGSQFGAQWRERFWAVYIRNDKGRSESLDLTLEPRFHAVGDVIAGYCSPEHRTFPELDVKLEVVKERLIKEAKCTEKEMSYLFDPQDPHHHGGLGKILAALKFPDWDPGEVRYRYVSRFSVAGMSFLSPSKLCPTLLGGSWWYNDGRNLSESAYKRIMGFPAEYDFVRNPTRKFLSKGVVPQVAEWILEQVGQHLGYDVKRTACFICERSHDVEPYKISCDPNSIADFRYKKGDWGMTRPPLKRFNEMTTEEESEI